MAGSYNIRLHLDNIADSATITASTQAASYPATNVQTLRRQETYRSTSGTSAVITVNMSALIDKYIKSICLLNHNLYVGTVQFEFSDAADFSSLIYDSGAIVPRQQVFGYGSGAWGDTRFSWGGYIKLSVVRDYAPDNSYIYYLPSVIKANYCRITMTEPVGSGLSYIELGRLFIGKYDTPDYNISKLEYQPIDESEISGAVINIRPKRKRLLIEFPMVSKRQSAWLFKKWFYKIGKRTPVLINPLPEGSSEDQFFYPIYGVLENIPAIGYPKHGGYDVINGSIQIREFIE